MRADVFVGQSKSAIMAHFKDSVAFLHWVYLPTLGVVLSFDRQICCAVAML